MTAPNRTAVHGWGRVPTSWSEIHEIHPKNAAAALLAATGDAPSTTHRGVLAHGRGRSYGDAALNSGGHLLRLRDPGPAGIALDVERGIAVVEAGVTLDSLLSVSVAQGWFLPVSPGTRQVTVGGAIAAHVHGKNHHRDGSFGAHVDWIDLLLANGDQIRLTKHNDPDLWWATVGGMGLTGLILAAQVRMMPISTSRCRVDTDRVANLDDLMELMATSDHRYRYSVAWIDLLARGASLGRGVLTRGDHAQPEDLASGATGRKTRATDDRLAYRPTRTISVPRHTPHLLNRWAVQAFNQAYYRAAPRHKVGEITSIGSFFHPLDAIANWNRLYGRQGFFQYQFVVPFGREDALRRAVEMVAGHGAASFLAVLKRFGPGDEALLGFPIAGWTLTMDLPAHAADLTRLVNDLDDLVIEAGGRIYLAKDAVSKPEVITAGYPELARWREIRERVDPERIWISDLARRLGLLENGN
jgi:decaprenylphospho-beta-D-ribofuranose 2-oxidase